MSMDEEYASYQTRSRWHISRAGLVVILIVANLVISVIGGITGFVLLSNTDASWARTVRNVLHVGDVTSVTIPTHETVTLTESSAVIDASKKVSPSVVAISGSQQVTDFYGRVSSQESGGSGFILTSDGLIVTNRHVVDGVNTTYKVILSDGRILDATVKAIDTLNDLAIVKVDAKDLPTVEIGSSTDLQIGQTVIAIGNALGQFQNSVTLGVVSAKGRTLSAGDTTASSETLTDLIQTDAAINPGNSGGPLVNVRGQVVGINTAIASQSGGSEGIGFAISIDSIKSVLDSVRKTGKIVRAYLGIRTQTIDKSLQQIDNLSVDYGAFVVAGTNPITQPAVATGSPADKAGIKAGDIILEINGERIDSNHPLPSRIAKYQVGDSVTVKLQRAGKEQTMKVTLGELPQS
jgi:serine protease Do